LFDAFFSKFLNVISLRPIKNNQHRPEALIEAQLLVITVAQKLNQGPPKTATCFFLPDCVAQAGVLFCRSKKVQDKQVCLAIQDDKNISNPKLNELLSRKKSLKTTFQSANSLYFPAG
jgi:hypothetical protein